MSATSLALMIAVSMAPGSVRFNFEPVVLGAVGLVAVTFGTVAFLRAEETYTALRRVRTDDVTTAEQARERVQRAAELSVARRTPPALACGVCLSHRLAPHQCSAESWNVVWMTRPASIRRRAIACFAPTSPVRSASVRCA